ncbi:MAG: TIR domain-containing protein [Candidatus Helarchaeota archaeon]|nr:TIR domain-containing protein [Candidatus Helarchaeota archaeon]
MAESVKSIFEQSKIDACISGQAEAKSLPESIRDKIRNSEALLTLITEKHSNWVQNEIGIAYDANTPVYAIVQKGVRVEGILPYITVYETYDSTKPQAIESPVKSIIGKILRSRKDAIIEGLLFAGILVLIYFCLRKR